MRIFDNHPHTRSVLLAVWIGINLFFAFFTVFSAYGGVFNPDERVVGALVAMLLPGALIADIILIILNIFLERRLILLILASWLVSLSPILTFCPLNIPAKSLSDNERKHSFTLLTYNIMHFQDFRDYLTGLKSNATLDYIIKTDADIVFLQECEELWSDGTYKVTPEQLKAVKEAYPHRIVNSNYQLTILSKFPCEIIPTGYSAEELRGMAFYRLNIMGDTVNMVNVHLQSIGLTHDDKELYKEAIYIPTQSGREIRDELKEVKSQLLSKLFDAFRKRAAQARLIRNVIDSIGGPFIVAGDFNDIPDCYAVRTIRGDDMTDAYAEAAFGPCITFNADRFYFRIDQILYRGPFRAAMIQKGDSKSSDHSPLFATFVFDSPPPLAEHR